MFVKNYNMKIKVLFFLLIFVCFGTSSLNADNKAVYTKKYAKTQHKKCKPKNVYNPEAVGFSSGKKKKCPKKKKIQLSKYQH